MSGEAHVIRVDRHRREAENANGQEVTIQAIRLLKRRPWGIVGALILLAVIVTAILAPVIAPYQPNEISITHRLQPPGGDFILGTDNLGRDVFTRLLYGSRPYVQAGLTATGMAIVLGLLLGLISASIGGKTDVILRRAVLFPPMLLGVELLFVLTYYLTGVLLPRPLFALSAAMGPPEVVTIYVPLLISFVCLPAVYSVVRAALSSAVSEHKSEAGPDKNSSAFNSAAFRKGLVPLVPLTLVNLAVATGLAVAVISSISYYGFGVPPPTPEWGGALSSTGRSYLLTAPWMAGYPAIAIVVALVGTILFGQTVHEIWFPRIASPLPAGSRVNKA